MSLDQFVKVYLDWVNNFETVKAFADHYGITYEEAETIIKLGHQINYMNIDFGHTNH